MLATGLCVFLVLALAGSVSTLLPEDFEDRTAPANLQEECASKCPDLDLNQNRTDDSSSEVGCGVRCKIDQCTKGCGAWQRALDTSCQAVCNGTQELLPPKELYCVLGCHDALNRYFQQLKAEIGIPPAPALVADSLTATSLRLEWKGIDIERRGGGISYLVQWRYEELAETWQYCRNQSWGEDDQILVENLQPYTKYRFRVALLLKSSQHNPEPIVSAPSVVIRTLAAGLPTSAPVIVRAVAVDSCRASVSWEPGPFPNGPLLSYVLRLQGADHSQLKDIPASENTDHYMFQNLEPNKNYSISVTMRNGVGEGPPAVTYIMTTPEPAVKDTQQPILILGGQHVVTKQNADMLDDPSVVYENTSTIRGVAIHVASAQLFISDSLGYVYRTSITKRTIPTVILSPSQVNFKPLSLSVDWLNLHLYILGEVKHATTVWQIARCNLDGRGLTVAVAGFLTRPTHIEVDPYNGYLFWVTRGGLFRLDLADISNGVKHEIQPYLILEDADLGAFTVDHTNFRLLVPHHIQNTVISVSLDGREVLNLRANTQQPKFKNVVSLAMANGLFYWTNGEEVLIEGYHPGQNRYFHNAYPDRSNGSFVSVNVLMNASQPVPVPVNPPTGVQAVLGVERAKVSWQAPHLLGGQGKGAWQNWSYELEIKDESTGETIHQKDIAGSSHTVHNLREKSEYSIKAAAYTSAGRGPWSTEFRGRTLRDGSHASILWSANEGLLRSDVTGENIDTLIYKASLKETEVDYHIVDVSWYKDVLYIVGNNSALYRYNITSHQKMKMNIHSVGSVAVDWISKKLYWANPKQQIITRANLNGSHQEPMSILAIVKELMIDSLEAYLYWSTGHAVEVARLNGQDRRYYHSDEIFNGKQVMGLTLDTENRFVYWIVRSYESGSIVYRAPTSERISMSHKIVPEKISALQHPNMQGPLCYFSEHLLWLQDDRNAVIGDLSGQNTAIINGITLSGLHMIAIMDPALHQYPKNFTSETVTVLPNAVNYDSIRVEGTWRNFNISWDPVENINYGTVFYEVKFADYINTNSNPEITTETSMPYNNSEQILPYSVLEVTVKAFTYWETAHHTRKILRSPQSVPSQPTNSRAFIEFHKEPLSDNIDIFAIFRWDQPEFTNGLITGYTVQCWFKEHNVEIQICDQSLIPSTLLEYTVQDLLPNMTYYFQVRAHTKIGAGLYTDVINISTIYENPVPQLLVATMDAVRISDLDQEVNYTITRHIAVEVTYLATESKIYWINEMRELVTSDLNGSNATKMLALNNSALSITVDWVARHLYWSELSYRENGGRIMKLDLTLWQVGILKYESIVTSNRRIVNLDILPSTGSLYWIETKKDGGIIMQSNLDGTDIQPFFNYIDDCSCPYRPSVSPVMTIDSTNFQKPVMYWISLEGHLNIADIDGCACNLIASASFNKGLPPKSLTVDKMNIYWSNIAEDQIYFVNKKYPDDAEIRHFYLPSVRSIKALGKSLQTYPITNCLIPRQGILSYNVEEMKKSANSITVRLPEPVPQFGCERYSLPTTLYTIYVSQCLENDPNMCENGDRIKLQTYKKEYEIKDLKPFTNYGLKLALSNYYANLESMSLEFGSGVVLQTEAGAPTAPENVTVEALTPTLAIVYWMPPKILNAPAVRYEVHWRLVRLINGARQKGEFIKGTERTTDGRYFTMLEPWLPDQEYLVFVRAYPTHVNDVYSESSSQVVKMYPEPNNLTLTGVSVNSLNVSWVPTINLMVRYTLEYKDVAMEDWQVANDFKVDKDKVTYFIKKLQPRTLYKFHLLLRYPNYKKDFVWPTDGRFTFQTLGDVPSAPGMPTVTKLRNSVYQLNWKPAQAHGSQITLYRVEGMKINEINEQIDSTGNASWKLYYNGTDNYWIITGDMDDKYRFRVQARNAYGFGGWSRSSPIIDLTEATGGILAAQQHLGLVLGLSVPVIIIMLICSCYFLCLYRQRKEDKKAVLPPLVSDVELATLREIPRGNFVQSNALYASTLQNDSDDSTLPKIRREQITLAKFLGSGAFGEVFQGNAKDLERPGITPVAIKTLRKGASAQEKTEFLQEARLMSHFRHKHVLRLLGVCLDTDPPLLVLELMEAGDLLSYLRASRSLQPSDSHALRLQDLLAMCEDVARGCRYLEELHFVHRDLACRNCLVSAKDRENRVVKIGDFGLARDIYKNDYYRKEGEGLLPVRWMAPESLVDGVFTSQSDVWAFGVLMWEITSLGQQPYPARTNIEVLHHVRAGGRLSKPLNCPLALHQLMLRCWSDVDTRPSFKVCLENIVSLRSTIEDAQLNPVASYYLSRRGVSNMAYFADENQNHNNSGNSWKSSSSEGSRDMQPFLQNSHNATPTSQSGEMPKYLELLADNEDIILKENSTNGYEVPRSIHISDQNLANTNKASTNVDVKSNLHSDASQEQKDIISSDIKEQLEKKCDKRSSISSLNLPERKRASITNMTEKCNTLDSSKLTNPTIKAILKRDSFTSLTDQRKNKRNVTERRGSEISLEGRSSSSLSSNISLAPPTRPSSSLISSQNVLPLKNCVIGGTGESTDNVAKNTLPKIQRTHSNLQNGKANIPLVINSALLNLLRQTPVVEDSNNIVTYTNINTDAVRVNGS
ncbi:proto-oncogene tyrosine-protein kinase ROS isoform X2 [Apis mellifera]|uniref:Tyrosine-protein kinase receptor n=1 Tax=Apis mellifera TaxID=7460 RepID=A0A7M7H0A5_APIME|nr:proto-oncogene tyrosine-protein kinase ROS isoform X2 [Apis mellifera]|eukprot:XP_006571430.2 proto-oncogene tyrosine-protein kinase ROS isoform X2 [Apis mellifera]